jgi:galactonate dehydratase
MASVQDIQVSPHCSIGPVALAAALHFDLSTPNFMIQENFAEFDSPSAQRAGFGLESKPWW